jgi:hypothetical protein
MYPPLLFDGHANEDIFFVPSHIQLNYCGGFFGTASILHTPSTFSSVNPLGDSSDFGQSEWQQRPPDFSRSPATFVVAGKSDDGTKSITDDAATKSNASRSARTSSEADS